MPFHIWITRFPSYDAIFSPIPETTAPEDFLKMLITADEFHSTVSMLPNAVQRSASTYWLYHSEQEPWMAVTLNAIGAETEDGEAVESPGAETAKAHRG
eukprot:TRINITY_DN4136_c0_g1_i1.p2 TRINITY_DN4136_c0_g1~~TRINITY_DN4136_c0_g1_i1.p2  ORF type:complete len:99 (+),score=5.23 TRINITY_DN4136_c0_g1_i1:94-390(+)